MGQMTRLIGKMTEKSLAELKPKASYYNYLTSSGSVVLGAQIVRVREGKGKLALSFTKHIFYYLLPS